MSLLENLVRAPEMCAVEDARQQRSWSSLWDRATRIAHFMTDELNLVPGDHVASLQGNNVEFYEMVLAFMAPGGAALVG
ncbi:MAG TPA: AMP-binding protein [Acidimicrobiales bacterium]|nr:AMP-binding protein [Acidimicrobiales bacterium]